GKIVKKVLLIASYDSFLNSGYAVAKEIKDAQIDIYIHKSRENILSNRQLLESGIDKDQAIFFFILMITLLRICINIMTQ
ncbi:TPA: hypothetical protein ACFN86_002075, partial [Neisseria meningitidis]